VFRLIFRYTQLLNAFCVCRVCCRLGRVAGTQREVLVWLGMRQELGAHDKQRKAMAINLQCAARGLLASKLSACPFSRLISDFLSLSVH
jgi:hypothetical protein